LLLRNPAFPLQVIYGFKDFYRTQEKLSISVTDLHLGLSLMEMNLSQYAPLLAKALAEVRVEPSKAKVHCYKDSLHNGVT
jgi:hypothetical protein